MDSANVSQPPPLPPLAARVRRPERGFWSALLLGLAGVAVFLGTQFGIALIFGTVRGAQYFVEHRRAMPANLLEQFVHDPLLLAICVLASVPVIWGTLFVMVRIQRGGNFARYLALRGFGAGQFLLWLALLAVVFFGSQWLLRGFDGESDEHSLLNLLLPAATLPWMALAIALGAPLAEEPLFRGFMYRGLARSRGTTVVALVLPNVLWVALHLQYRWPALVVLFLAGLVLGLARYFSGSTLLPIVLHGAMNTISLLVALCVLHPASWSRGIDLSRKTVRGYTLEAAAAKQTGDDETEREAYTHLLELEPGNLDILEKRGLLDEEAEDYDSAIADFSTLIRLEPDSSRYRYLRAHAATFRDDNKSALADLDRAIALDAKAYRAYALRAYIREGQHDFPRAIADNKVALALHPDFLPALRGLGHDYQGIRDYDGAIKQFSRTIQLAPGSAHDLVSRGVAYGWKGDHDRAITDFSAAIRLAPHYAIAYADRGYAWMQKRAYRRAFLDLTRALEFDPENTHAANDLAWLLATCPDPIFRDGAQAVRYAEQVCRATDWGNAAYLDTLAAAYAERGDWAKAIWWQERYLALVKNPDDMARLRLTRYRHHQAYTD